MMRRYLCIFVMLLVAGVSAADIIDAKEPILKIVYDGPTPIASNLASKTLLSQKIAVLKDATVSAMNTEKYPLAISTTVTIDKYRCEGERCAYWITAARSGRPVAVNNPIWLIPGNAPYHTVVSDVYDSKTNTQTITLKEDPKGAIINILQQYADMQPVGTPVVGTKE